MVAERPRSPLAAIVLRVRAGTGMETAETNGCAHFIEHVVFKGGGKRQPGDYDREIELLGGEFFARTTRDFTEYSVIVPTEKLGDALGLMADLVRTPEFRAADVDRERRVIAREMADANCEVAQSSFRLVCSVAYPEGHTYRLPLMGTPETLAARTPDDLRAFWQKWYRPDNMTLVVSGGVTAADVRKVVEPLFPMGEKGPDSTPAVTVFTPIGRVARAAVLPAEAQAQRALTTLTMAFRIPTIGEGISLPLLEALVTCMAGSGGRLPARLIVKDRVALSVSAEFSPGVQESLILVTATGEPRSITALEAAFEAEIRRMREDSWTDDEVEAAKAATEGRLQYARETVEGHARLLANWDQYAPTMTEETYTKQIAALGKEEVRAVTLRYLTPLSFAVASVGPVPAGYGEGQP